MKPKYHTFALFVLYNVVSQLENEIEDGDTELPTIAYRLYGQGKLWLRTHSFRDDETKLLLDMKDDDEFDTITMHEVSFLLFALELMRIYSERIKKKKMPMLNISDKKLLMGSKRYVMDMLKLKRRDKAKYDELKELFRTTEQVATELYEYMWNKITKHYEKGRR